MLVAEALIAKVFQIPLDMITNILIKKMLEDLISLRFRFWCYVMKCANFDYFNTSARVRGFLFAGYNNVVSLISC